MKLSHDSWLSMFVATAAASLCLGVGCVFAPPTTGSLAVTRLDSTTIAGSLVTEGSKISFESSSNDQRVVALHLDVNGAAMDFTYDTRGTLTEDGHLNALHAGDLSALLTLRDAINGEYPEVVQSSLQGRFLSRHADWLADAPAGFTVEARTVDAQDRIAQRKLARSTGDDDANTTCLRAGFTYRAWFDAGTNGQVWFWDRVANSGSCLGRCGAGCNIFDHDLMLDCFEHDSCIDFFGGSSLGNNPDCGDEFRNAEVEYVVTLGDWCLIGG
jgi:hypothetical protein